MTDRGGLVAGQQTLNLQNFDNMETKGSTLIVTLPLIFALQVLPSRYEGPPLQREEDRVALHDSFL
jgi:hypothetical protein